MGSIFQKIYNSMAPVPLGACVRSRKTGAWPRVRHLVVCLAGGLAWLNPGETLVSRAGGQTEQEGGQIC